MQRCVPLMINSVLVRTLLQQQLGNSLVSVLHRDDQRGVSKFVSHVGIASTAKQLVHLLVLIRAALVKDTPELE
eukprot:CAMPEP_0175943528 /NCGR_PEP_ID=MMETSP0108-20121206/25610_1 /TAXON_ID=195067 ORGANISM="Goniomonas pacifica, Strain CCMP1869" /NCGR_SAMPLE_ID=MMETSP0108 /ASSEMBLY_ACC=CAM_ASM_000204 /LENGTH=73 /DNA_ID=CAMNT_0017268517 /DNA_START=143 /DNA_END=364 /DNA_ORIENTATION=+